MIYLDTKKPAYRAVFKFYLCLYSTLILDSGNRTFFCKCLESPFIYHKRQQSFISMSAFFPALQVKCYLKRLGNRVGKKTLLSKSLPGPNVATLDVNGECKFKIPRENFTDFDLTCAVSSKHKIIGKKLLLGKAVIGGNSKDDTGVSHWKTISHSPGIAWTVWHPIYNN